MTNLQQKLLQKECQLEIFQHQAKKPRPPVTKSRRCLCRKKRGERKVERDKQLSPDAVNAELAAFEGFLGLTLSLVGGEAAVGGCNESMTQVNMRERREIEGAPEDCEVRARLADSHARTHAGGGGVYTFRVTIVCRLSLIRGFANNASASLRGTKERRAITRNLDKERH